MNTKSSTILRSYPVEWPIFSVKNYVKDVDGWWNWCPKKRKKQENKFQDMNNTNKEEEEEVVRRYSEIGNFLHK